MWGPTVISWFISPSNYFVLSTINHSYWSCVHQLSYRGRGPRMIIIITKTLGSNPITLMLNIPIYGPNVESLKP